MTLNGMDIYTVEPGTEIEHEGKKLVVTDTNAVTLGRKVYNPLKAHSHPA